MKKINVMSLFDGASFGKVALERAGIEIENYYASEIDKYAIKISEKNHPNIIQIGDVTKIDFLKYTGKIDLLMGGSPCQDLSIAGKRNGLAGERSGLFYKFIEALETIKPKYFLLENNYGMPKEAFEEISKLMGCYPILINSALVSAQTRKRFYWTNIGPKSFNLFGFPTVAIPQPEDKGILLKDVLEKGYSYSDKSFCITANYFKGGNIEDSLKKNRRTLIAETIQDEVYPCALRNRGQGKQPEFNNTDKANSLTTVQTDSMVCVPVKIKEATKKGYVEIFPGEVVDLKYPESKSRRGRKMSEKANTLTCQNQFYQYLSPVQIGYIKSNAQTNRVYSVNAKSVTLKANAGGGGAKTGLYKINLPDGEYLFRKLTPIECERLQTVDDNYTAGVSDTQRYKILGNGWTVDVLAHIFKYLKEELCKN